MLNFSKSDVMKKQTHLHLGWPEGESIFSKFSFLGELFPLRFLCTCKTDLLKAQQTEDAVVEL